LTTRCARVTQRDAMADLLDAKTIKANRAFVHD
jgi:hypothetical protein